MDDKYFSVDHEPALSGGRFEPDPAEQRAQPVDRPLNEMEALRDSVAAEPALPGHADPQQWNRWLAAKRRQCTPVGDLAVTLIVALASGPFAILGALMTGRQDVPGYLYAVIFGPVVEELLKQSGMTYLLEQKPYRVFAVWQFPFAAAICPGRRGRGHRGPGRVPLGRVRAGARRLRDDRLAGAGAGVEAPARPRGARRTLRRLSLARRGRGLPRDVQPGGLVYPVLTLWSAAIYRRFLGVATNRDFRGRPTTVRYGRCWETKKRRAVVGKEKAAINRRTPKGGYARRYPLSTASRRSRSTCGHRPGVPSATGCMRFRTW